MSDIVAPRRSLAATLLNDDPIVAILRGQLFIEDALERLLLRKTGEASSPLFEFMDFNSKVRAAKSLGILNVHDDTALQAVAKIRNQFAHRLNRVLTTDDDDYMYNHLRGNYRKLYDMLTVTWHRSPRFGRPGFKVIMAFTAVIRMLTEYDPEYQDLKQRFEKHPAPEPEKRDI